MSLPPRPLPGPGGGRKRSGGKGGIEMLIFCAVFSPYFDNHRGFQLLPAAFLKGIRNVFQGIPTACFLGSLNVLCESS